VNSDDVRIVERGKHPRLALEPFAPFRARGHVGWKHFHGHVASSFVSVARYTSPIPPAPRADLMW
jgi:hypothetical protein